MIFMSHNHKDKDFVEHISTKIAEIYGKENVFYDSWSIQPGEGIIERMNAGLQSTKFFFFFVTTNSLNSKMVSLEWQNALMKSSTGDVKFIPIKCDDSPMPALLTQSVYLDLYSTGIDVIITQMKDIIDGNSTFKPKDETFSNLSFDRKIDDKKLKIRITADYFSEVLADFAFAFDGDYKDGDILFNVINESSLIIGHFNGSELEDGKKYYILRIALQHGIKPKIPVEFEFYLVEQKVPDLYGVMSKETSSHYKAIPFKKKDDFSGFPLKF